ncbi:MAG: NAD(P)/FAD-dependent oxidoreductase [Pseudomonadota bacterium]
MTRTDSIGDTRSITIVGAGLAGCLLSIYLARRGFAVELFERDPDLRTLADGNEGRSINLALANRGIAALRGVGLQHRVGAIALPMAGRMVHLPGQEPTLLPYGQSSAEVIYSVHRSELNQTLLDAAERTRRVRCHFRQRLEKLDLTGGVGHFVDESSGREYQLPLGPTIGADGVGSRVRQAIDSVTGGTSRSDLLDHGYREFQIPPEDDGRHALSPGALHIWPRGELMLIALPNTDGSFTATLFMAREGGTSFASFKEPAAMARFLKDTFPDVADRLEAPNANQPTVGVLGSLYCDPWHHEGNALVVGDAAHAIVPFHGQGMNCAFEDVAELDRCITDSTHWSQAFRRFQVRRQDNARAIAEMALENYHEMRSAVADPGYRLRRALEQALERRFPERFVPRYSLVMFRQLDYRRAQERGRINLSILHALTDGISSLDDVDWARAEVLVNRSLEPLSPA